VMTETTRRAAVHGIFALSTALVACVLTLVVAAQIWVRDPHIGDRDGWGFAWLFSVIVIGLLSPFTVMFYEKWRTLQRWAVSASAFLVLSAGLAIVATAVIAAFFTVMESMHGS
jgi:hypothetical protein